VLDSPKLTVEVIAALLPYLT